MVAQARDEYGTIGIYLDVNTSKGSINRDRKTVTEGSSDSAINIGVTDSNQVRSSALTGVSRVDGGRFHTILNVSQPGTHSGTLGHELAHHISGDTSAPLIVPILNLISFGSVNAVADIGNDLTRWGLSGQRSFSGSFFPSNYGAIENPWRRNARSMFPPRTGR